MKEALKWLNFGQIKPSGWILEKMNRQLSNGFIGKLDKIVPDLIVKDDIYGKDRLTKKIKNKDVGAIAQDDDWKVQYLWWNSETQSNWWDGLVRTTILTEDAEYLEKVKDYIEDKLATQDEDGYMGIYAPDLRFNFNSENGELWAQTSLFRVLLGYYEATGDKRIIETVERAVNVIMAAYPMNASEPFKADNSYAGLTHGLMITDILDRLHQLTDNEKYLEYAKWLYDDYCSHELSEKDIQINKLLDREYRFSGHGVHTYEHLRALVVSYYYSGEEIYKRALEEYFEKLELCICPSGSPIGDEWISGNTADATVTGYEYCSIHELLDSYSSLLQKTGDMKYADKIEHLFYNGAHGAKHPQESSIAYLKTDNSYSMRGVAHIENKNSMHTVQTRYKYSPSHQDDAVCCVPNAGRIYPYFVRAMWLKNENGLVAALFGPCKLKEVINGVNVDIEEKTNYPFEDEIKFSITPENPIKFSLCIRKPSWSKYADISVEGAEITEDNEMIIITKNWSGCEQVAVKFEASIKINTDMQGEKYITKGAIVYAFPIKSEMKIGKEYGMLNLRDLYYEAIENTYENLGLIQDSIIDASTGSQYGKLALQADFIDKKTKEIKSFKLIPLGATILRRVTFPAN